MTTEIVSPRPVGMLIIANDQKQNHDQIKGYGLALGIR
jgi:hypothetical protein